MKTFQICASWVKHDDFHSFLKGAWETNSAQQERVHNLQEALRKWNKDVFDNILNRTRSILKRLDNISFQMRNNFDNQPKKQQQSTQQTYQEVLR